MPSQYEGQQFPLPSANDANETGTLRAADFPPALSDVKADDAPSPLPYGMV
jgi:hypothetical protein